MILSSPVVIAHHVPSLEQQVDVLRSAIKHESDSTFCEKRPLSDADELLRKGVAHQGSISDGVSRGGHAADFCGEQVAQFLLHLQPASVRTRLSQMQKTVMHTTLKRWRVEHGLLAKRNSQVWLLPQHCIRALGSLP